MIGGVVIETIVLPDRVWINCEETDSISRSAIFVERDEISERAQIGDSIWWQSRLAMWTPFGNNPHGRCGVDYDIKLNRIGYSGAKRPQPKDQ